jgi:Na+/H+ antiporter
VKATKPTVLRYAGAIAFPVEPGETMEEFELIVILMAVVVGLDWLAARLRVPPPMLLMLGGLALALAPWTPKIELEPEVVLVIFLPPILFQAAQLTSVRDFRANFGPISRLAIGLVLVTTALVALVAHTLIPEMSWAAAFVLGAVVSPPDAVAATAIFQRVGAPRRIVTILEGESLINDASAIVLYTFAVAAVVTGTFSAVEALTEFVVVVVVGIVVGLATGRLLGELVKVLHEPALVATATLISPTAIYVLAEQLQGSGVLAVVTAGIVHGHRSSRIMTPQARNRNRNMWDQVMTVMEGLIFILIGLELGALEDVLDREDVQQVVTHSLVIFVALVVARFAYVFGGTWAFRSHIPVQQTHRPNRNGRHRPAAPAPLDWRGLFLIAWSGLRGVVSLATALALPLVTDAGLPFDHRDEIILITAAIIVLTLFGLGLPLPWLVRRLKLADDGSHEREMMLALSTMREAMHDEMRLVAQEDPAIDEMVAPILREIQAEREAAGEDTAITWEELDAHARPRRELRQRMVESARAAVLDLRDRGLISDEVLREVEHDLDLQALQLIQ